MKTRFIPVTAVLIAFLWVFNSGLLFAEPPDPSVAIRVKDKIARCFKLPARGFLTTDSFQANITFYINKRGHIKVRDLSCDNEEVKTYIKQEMQCICCRKIKAGYNKTYDVTLVYNACQFPAQGKILLNSPYLASKSSP